MVREIELHESKFSPEALSVSGMLLGKTMFVWLKDDGTCCGLQCRVGCLLFSFLYFYASLNIKTICMMFY